MQTGVRRAALACLSALAVTGCATGAGRAQDAAQTVMMSAARSEAASTFHLSVTETMSTPSGAPSLGIGGVRMQGDFDLSTHSASMTGTLMGAPQKPGTAPRSLTFSVIQIGNQSWDSIGGSGGLGPAGHWVKDSTSSPSNPLPDAAGLFAALKSKATQVRLLGKATVGGVVTEHYQLEGPSSLFDSIGGGSSGSQEAPLPGPVTVQVWVDRSNLIRQLTTTVEQEIPGAPGRIESETVSAEFSKYGEPLHIQPPPSS